MTIQVAVTYSLTKKQDKSKLFNYLLKNFNESRVYRKIIKSDNILNDGFNKFFVKLKVSLKLFFDLFFPPFFNPKKINKKTTNTNNIKTK